MKGGKVMDVLVQMVLPFKVEATDELLAANAGLALFGELFGIETLVTPSREAGMATRRHLT